MPSGEWLVSTTATTGMPSFFASVTAILWKPTSMTNIASGSAFMSLMPPIDCDSLASSRLSDSASRLVMRSNVPSVDIVSRSFSRLIDCLTVLKLVSMPPSQRWST